MRLFGIGDCHLRDDSETLKWSVNQKGLLSLVENMGITKEDIVVQVGDMSDSPKHRGATNKGAGKVVATLSKLAKQVFLLAGNHDSSRYSGHYLDTFDIYDNVTVVKDITVQEWSGKYFLFIPYIEGVPPCGKLEERVNEYLVTRGVTKVDYIFGHHFFKENTVVIRNDAGEVISSPHLDLDLINVEYTYAIQGHNHKYQQLSKKNYCTGSISPWNKSDADNDFYYMSIDMTNDQITVLPIFHGLFAQICTFDYDPTAELPGSKKDFFIVKVKCRKSEKYLLESKIKESGVQIYDIEWELTDVDQEFAVTSPLSGNDLIKEFFKESKEPSEVQKSFWNYYGGTND
jgi:DNA repair exonuclease SbcCD nuclease subunit